MAKFVITLLSLLAVGALALPSEKLDARQCGQVLAPYDIVLVNGDNPTQPGAHSAPTVIASQDAGKAHTIKALLRFKIPASAAMQRCDFIMNFPTARFNEVYQVKPVPSDPNNPVLVGVYKVEQNPTPPADPTYNQIVQTYGPDGVWSVAAVKPGLQLMNGERCDQLKDFLVQVPNWVQEKTGVSWNQQILEAANDGDNSFGMYLRYGC